MRKTRLPGAPTAVTVVVYDLREPFDAGLLSDQERARVARFASRDPARRWAAGRAGLRQVLAGALQADPSELVIAPGPSGKPRLAGSQLKFNKSDSGELAAVALCDSREVGLDIERHRDVKRAGRIARRFFSVAEQQQLAALPVGLRHRAFFDCWTLKEAVLKCDGGGLGAIPMASYSAPLDPEWNGTISERWYGARPNVGPDVSAAVALAGRAAAAVTVTSRKGDVLARV